MSTSGATDRAGRQFGVSLRELAQDLGIPNPWRKWTLDGWVEEMAKLVGDPDVRSVQPGGPWWGAGAEAGVFCCHMVPARGPGVWYRYAMLPRPPGEGDVEARSHAAASAVLICARLERLGQEAPPELRAMAVRVLAEGGVRWVGGAL